MPVSKTPSAGYPQKGEVWLVNLPNQPNDTHQPRPAIIVSVNQRNKWCGDVIVVPVTSSPKRSHPQVHVAIPAGEGGLLKDSTARCDQITTLDKSLLGRAAVGTVSHQYSAAIIEGVRAAMGDPTV
jgi:mRNA interferase MazF